MNRTTIMLPTELRHRAIDEARRIGISLAELIRQSLTEHLRASQGSQESDPFFLDTAVFDGNAPSDLSEKHDDYLYGGSK